MTIVRVALDIPLATLFDYTVAEGVAVQVGQRVVVPFGTRQRVGVILECTQSSELPVARLKQLLRVLQDCAPLSAGLLALLKFCSDYYHYPIGQTVLPALPQRLRSEQAITVQAEHWYRLGVGGQVRELGQFPSRKRVQKRLLDLLAQRPCCLAELKTLSASATSQLKSLEEEGWIEQIQPPQQQRHAHVYRNVHSLTSAQQEAVDAVGASHGYTCFLLHGITGSGKTEVYVHLIHQVLHQAAGGKQVLLLVPEINLTPQLEQYFRSRFPDVNLVSLHSGLNETERLHNWLEAQSGAAEIVLGTRLSVFAELPGLALIIVDEEHDSSYKQQDGLRYSARDVAIFRASQQAVPIVLGSATPSLESYHNAQSGRYLLLKLTARAQAESRLPQVRCIHSKQVAMHQGISEKLLDEIALRIGRGEQSLLFLNRRGYAPVLMCTECGWLSGCKNCAGKMVLHLDDRRLRCHHCGYQQRMPPACPTCGNAELLPLGSGTQRVESVLQERFPAARILRVDRDSTRNKRAWEEMRAQIHANSVDILVGTQMLAKGHDFPALTLVGALNPDSALYSSDFRAAEKLFAQLVQVAGRAGRADKPGEVWVQTEFPDHPLYRALQKHDFDGFAAAQLAERRMTGFPPFVYQAMLRAEGREEEAVYDYLERARKAALALGHNVEIYGVVPAALPRRANHFRAQLLVQSALRRDLQQFLRAWRLEPAPQLRCSLDVDPLEF